ncbi:unnamed protein product [Mycena citricolor]|uniref:Uncharacterized protein n=1 Tax=Mycena citricolor TaxID=2018698 RepID=A0AAD2HQE6_9AGAR|nr:unnamed protein product [Mycena citricolor]
MLLPPDKHSGSQDALIQPEAGSSTAPPPPPFQDTPPLIDFSESTQPFVIFPGGEEPPPAFTPYEAECFDTGSGDIVSHDAHLNSDGEALYRFLLSQAVTPPTFRLHCRGSHTETRYRHVSERDSDGRTRTRRESYTETIVDFDFLIDASRLSGPTHWTVDDTEPVYRGGVVREIDGVDRKHKATRAEVKQFKKWREERSAQGLPPWVTSGYIVDSGDMPVLKSSRTLRQWADEYCASPKLLKEFTYEKVVYGWNIRQLEHAVRATILATPYHGDLIVEFCTGASKVYVRPDNRLSRMLSNKWIKVLLWITFIYPFIWLFKRFHKQGGGSWSVCGGAYALKDESLPPYIPSPDGAVGALPQPSGGRLREGEWFRKWQPTIVRAVATHYESFEPLYNTFEEAVPEAYALDGFGVVG